MVCGSTPLHTGVQSRKQILSVLTNHREEGQTNSHPGKLTYGKSPFLFTKSSFNGPCSKAVLDYQKVYIYIYFFFSGSQLIGARWASWGFTPSPIPHNEIIISRVIKHVWNHQAAHIYGTICSCLKVETCWNCLWQLWRKRPCFTFRWVGYLWRPNAIDTHFVNFRCQIIQLNLLNPFFGVHSSIVFTYNSHWPHVSWLKQYF